jgi:hypothetical protein
VRDSILIFAGTAAGGVGLEFGRKRADEVARVSSRLATSLNGQHAELARRLSDIRDGIHVLAVDVDTTNIYSLNTPLNDALPSWPIGEFVPCPLPGPDMVQSIREGQHPGRFEYLNGEAIAALHGHGDASGGVRMNGWLAAEANLGRIDQEIRRHLKGIITRRRILSRPLSAKIRIILVSGTFGGFGSGSSAVLRRLIADIARDMQLDVEMSCILLVPGTHTPKDPDSTFALTHAVLRELTAQSTRLHWHRRTRRGSTESVRSVFIPTAVVSDTNHAPGEPKAVSVENLTGQVAELLRTLCLTDLGPRLDALAADFQTQSLQPTATGEPRCGQSVGLATIHFDRDRQVQFTRAKLIDLVLSNSLDNIDAATLQRDVRAFYETRRIVQGDGVHQLSDRLLEQGDGRRDAVDIERFRRLCLSNTAGVKGLALLHVARARVQLSAQQAGDVDAAFAERAEDLVGSLAADVTKHTDDLVRDPRAGCGAASEWLTLALGVADNMLAEAGRDTAVVEGQVAQSQARVTHFEGVYIPQLRRKNFLYRWLRRGRIEANADDYTRCLEELQVARMRLAAHLRAIAVLQALHEVIHQRGREVQAVVDTTTAERDSARADIDRIAAHRPDFGCPVGFPLISGLEDLEALHVRLVPPAELEKVRSDVHARLYTVDDPLRVAADPAALHAQIAAAVETTFRERIDELHVVDEFRRRFPDPELRGAALRERVRESYEAVQLRDCCDQEHGVYLVRLLGVDANRMGDIHELLGRYDHQRVTGFQIVHIDDPDRIIFLQYRAVFPLSDWAHFRTSRETYERLSAQLPFEKFHVVPQERSLPVPGELLTAVAARVVAIKAWTLGRLDYDREAGTWLLLTADEAPLPLGKELEVLLGAEGYRRGVDISSEYGGHYLKHGPDRILEQLSRIRARRADRKSGARDLEYYIAGLVDDEVVARIERELAWWRRNSVAAAMEWGARAPAKGSQQRHPRLPAEREAVL